MGSTRAPGGNPLAAIDEIAGLSIEASLLAVNALAEAARAGERGRAVAELAQEVLALSGHTARMSHRLRASVTAGASRASGAPGLPCDTRRSIAAARDELRHLNQAVLAVISEVPDGEHVLQDRRAEAARAVDALVRRVKDRVGALESLLQDTPVNRSLRDPAPGHLL